MRISIDLPSSPWGEKLDSVESTLKAWIGRSITLEYLTYQGDLPLLVGSAGTIDSVGDRKITVRTSLAGSREYLSRFPLNRLRKVVIDVS